jgi:hypothetical protein
MHGIDSLTRSTLPLWALPCTQRDKYSVVEVGIVSLCLAILAPLASDLDNSWSTGRMGHGQRHRGTVGIVCLLVLGMPTLFEILAIFLYW